jgi:carbonic anhydrase/acetyltransferase-like protein (isoleucine patch superfamily)
VLGSPGKIVRTLDEEARQKLKEGAQGYIENGARFRKGLSAAEL